ncbi:MAG: nicotinate-nucleotide adenylyltransferase [Novosphingobium sp.]|nr:nicotinate-nucleotide adenylyltransferase [Novosphingobium sp.]
MSTRIGLFGGCFNPVHRGHIAVARAARAHLGLDKVLFIPSGHPPLKGDEGLLAGEERLAMLRLALAEEAGMDACDIEIGRAGPSYTVDTVRAFWRELPDDAEMFFLLGSDCLGRLPRWKGIDELHRMLRFAVVQRAGEERPLVDPRLLALPCDAGPVSSTLIRERLARGESVDDLVHRAVAARLAARRHYAAPDRVGA